VSAGINAGSSGIGQGGRARVGGGKKYLSGFPQRGPLRRGAVTPNCKGGLPTKRARADCRAPEKKVPTVEEEKGGAQKEQK